MTDKVREYLFKKGYKELSGDVNIEYGAKFIKWADEKMDRGDVVQITDLTDAGPSVDGWLVESLFVDLRMGEKDLKSALRYCGLDFEALQEIAERGGQEAGRLVLADAVLSYFGGSDLEAIVVRSERNADLKDWGKVYAPSGLRFDVENGWGLAAMLRAVKRVA